MGTIQGLILGPIRYTFFIRPLYKITKITTFIDDNYVVKYKNIKKIVLEELGMVLKKNG